MLAGVSLDSPMDEQITWSDPSRDWSNLLYARDPDSGRMPSHGERSRSHLLLLLAGTENILILAVHVLAVEPLSVYA